MTRYEQLLAEVEALAGVVQKRDGGSQAEALKTVFKSDPTLYARYREASYAERQSPAATPRPTVNTATPFGALVVKAAVTFCPEDPWRFGIKRVQKWMPDLWRQYRAESYA
jgi:hypothetical protein